MEFRVHVLAKFLNICFCSILLIFTWHTDGDPYQKQITECVALVSHEVTRQLASDKLRPRAISAQTAKLLAQQLDKTQTCSAEQGTQCLFVLSMCVFVAATTDWIQNSNFWQFLYCSDFLRTLFPNQNNISSLLFLHTKNQADSNKVKGITFHLSFQSRVGPVQWLRPYTDDMLKEMGEEEKVSVCVCMVIYFVPVLYFLVGSGMLHKVRIHFNHHILALLLVLYTFPHFLQFVLSPFISTQQVRNLIVVPVSFVSEHIETLEEIDMEYKELALESGVTHWERAPALNTEPGFIQDIADLVVSFLCDFICVHVLGPQLSLHF